MMKKGKKITVLGAGNVGATVAYTLVIAGLANEIVLIDIKKEKAIGEAMDILHGTPFTPDVQIYAGDFKDAAGSDIVVVAAGTGRKPGQSRLDLAQTNIDVIKEIIPLTVKHAPDAVYIIVSNPVDIITYVVCKISGLPPNQIVGSGTMLDTARLRTAVADHVKIPEKSIHTYVLGEHGDSQMVPWSLTSIAGMPMSEYCEYLCERHGKCGKVELNGIVDDVRTAGAKVIANKGATFYAVALAVRKLCDTVIRDADSVHTVSTMLNGEYGISDVCLSLPFIVNANGIKKLIKVTLTPDEKKQLVKSADTLKATIAALKI